MRHIACWFVLGLLVMPAQAVQSAHITDKLLAGFYEQPDAASQPLKVLPSGTPVEVLKKQAGFTRVRLGDNSEGWVESRYISDSKPAKVMLLELQAKHGRTKQQLRQAERELKRLRNDQEHRSSPSPSPSPDKAEPAAEDPAPAAGPMQGYLLRIWHLPLLALLMLIAFIGGIVFKNHRIAARRGRSGL